MKFTYSTNAFKRYSLWQAIQLIKEIGFAGVEIMADRPHLYPPDYQSREAIQTLRDQLASLGLVVSNLNTFTMEGYPGGDMFHPSWIEKEPHLRQMRYKHTKDCLRLASQLSCRSISTQPGGKVEGISSKSAQELFIHGLAEVIPLARQLGVKILVEPEPGLLIENSRQFAEFIKHTDTSVIGFNCDIGHFVCVGEEPAEVIRKLGPYLQHLHLEDVKNRTHRHLICGHGEINFSSIFKALRDINYQGFISIELYPYQDNPVEAGRESLKFLEQFL